MCICVCIYIYIYTHTYIYIYMYMHTYVCTYVLTCLIWLTATCHVQSYYVMFGSAGSRSREYNVEPNTPNSDLGLQRNIHGKL